MQLDVSTIHCSTDVKAGFTAVLRQITKQVSSGFGVKTLASGVGGRGFKSNRKWKRLLLVSRPPVNSSSSQAMGP